MFNTLHFSAFTMQLGQQKYHQPIASLFNEVYNTGRLFVGISNGQRADTPIMMRYC